MEGFDEFRDYCRQNGDSPEAVEDFVQWIAEHLHIWHIFEGAAWEESREHERPSPMRVMANMREKHRISVPNAVSAGLVRMVNCKARREVFRIGVMKTFSAKRAA